MKKIYLIFLTVGLSISNIGCNNILTHQPVGTQTVDLTFTDFAGSLVSVNGIYNVLSGGNLYRGNNNMLYVDLASNNVMNQGKVTSSAYSVIDYFELVANNSQTFEI